ncbi:MAG: DUF4157 domain-containing protein [Desulfobacula sp.]|nr:DUF4157 domain-containing protein [Desulfobacula sp.]
MRTHPISLKNLKKLKLNHFKTTQAKPESSHISDVNPPLESQIQSLKGEGRPLSANESSFFEPLFGRDFSQVRVHTDTRAAESAQAFTIGQDVVFGSGHLECSKNRNLVYHLSFDCISNRAKQVIK